MLSLSDALNAHSLSFSPPLRSYTGRLSSAEFEVYRNAITAGLDPNISLQDQFYLVSNDEELAQQLVGISSLIQPVYNHYRQQNPNYPSPQTIALAVWDELVGISVLGDLWRDKSVTEIMVNGVDQVWVERNGVIERTDITFHDEEHLADVAKRLAHSVSRRDISPSNPLITARLPEARVAIVHSMLVPAQDGPAITIRRFGQLLTASDLVELGAIREDVLEFLADCVRARANILIAGGTGAGKTTVINALSEFIPPTERVISVEDSLELDLRHPHWVAMQGRESASADDKSIIGIDQLLHQTLRMRPDRIIVGEVIKPAAALTLLEAANTGHDGTMTTLHANTARDALNSRLVALYLSARGGTTQQAALADISRAFDVVVFATRRRGRRYISEVALVQPFDMLSTGTNYIETTRIASATLDPKTRELKWRFDPTPALTSETNLGLKLEDEGLVERWRTKGNNTFPEPSATQSSLEPSKHGSPATFRTKGGSGGTDTEEVSGTDPTEA